MKLPYAVLIAALGFVQCAQAQTQAPAKQPSDRQAALKAVKNACMAEAMQICPGQRGEAAVACLTSKIDKLTPSCKDAVLKVPKPQS